MQHDKSMQRPEESLEPAPPGIEPEPDIDPDSDELLAQERPDPPHPPTRFDAGNGQGVAVNPPLDSGVQERPILDGSTQSAVAEASVPNPYRGQDDPGTISHQPALNTTGTGRWIVAGSVATALMTLLLLLLAQWNPIWCGVGVAVAVVSLLLMLAVRASKRPLRRRLRIEAILLAVIWLVPLAIFIWTLVAFSDEIWARFV